MRTPKRYIWVFLHTNLLLVLLVWIVALDLGRNLKLYAPNSVCDSAAKPLFGVVVIAAILGAGLNAALLLIRRRTVPRVGLLTMGGRPRVFGPLTVLLAAIPIYLFALLAESELEAKTGCLISVSTCSGHADPAAFIGCRQSVPETYYVAAYGVWVVLLLRSVFVTAFRPGSWDSEGCGHLHQ